MIVYWPPFKLAAGEERTPALRALLAATLIALSALAAPAVAQTEPPIHQGPWPIQNGVRLQPNQRQLKALHDQDITPSQGREVDRLYDELLSDYQGYHHTGNVRSR